MDEDEEETIDRYEAREVIETPHENADLSIYTILDVDGNTVLELIDLAGQGREILKTIDGKDIYDLPDGDYDPDAEG
jgi:hypothetical protein